MEGIQIPDCENGNELMRDGCFQQRHFIQKDPSVASPLDSGIDAVGGSSGAQEGERAGEGRPRGPGQVRRQWMHLEVQDSEKEEEKLADAIPPPASLASPSSSQQMKIISVLVSIAGIFCILLLFIIAALKCGLLDSQCEQARVL
uniref:Expressed conserved protein n=1 Tax=Echinococcus granulosus TaxID=6210 RepID=A0A068WET5_ECHGR|nr:hypothetical protein EgrG_000007700 [Echinococcus granulosus]